MDYSLFARDCRYLLTGFITYEEKLLRSKVFLEKRSPQLHTISLYDVI